MSVTDLRKELKDLRKSVMPTPVSRMKKTDVAREIERLKGLHGKEEKKVESVLEKADVPKKVAKKVSAVQEVEHKKQEEVVKKTKGVKAEPVKEEKPKAKKAESKAEKPKAEKKDDKKPGKGSEEMKARMAKLREMRKKKSDE
jgi:hypothetical protein